MRYWMVVALLVLAVPAAAQTVPGPVGQPTGQWRAQIYWVPMIDTTGGQRLLYAQLCRPPGEAPARVVVYAHGTPAQVQDRANVHPPSCDNEAFRWFLTRGYAVISSVRRGYGATGGTYAENQGSCDNADFVNPGLEAARDVAATVDYAATLPFLRPQGMVVVGLSSGGLAAIAYDSIAHPRVTALINMSGGRGGHHNNQPNSNCNPDGLAVAAGRFGASASTPMLWVYTANNSFFNPQIAAAMYAAFTRAGGRADFEALPPFGTDGHDLLVLSGGSVIWGPLVERYLATRPAQ
ncbi:MAG TPA: alpha/beta fold hydrolase [Stellaceae bacterium]|nr:alpha/beta fold hydrolase [Stellaceae bacterium]